MLDDVYRRLDEAEARARAGRDRMAQVRRFRERAADLVGRGEAADGRVVVEASARSPLRHLHIDPRAMRLGSEELAAAITAAFTAAGEDLRARTREILDEVGLTAMADKPDVEQLRTSVHEAQRELHDSVRTAAQRLDELARRRR